MQSICNELALWADSVLDLQCPDVVPLLACFFCVLLLPFSKVSSQIAQLQKDSLGKIMKGHWSQILQFWLRNGQKKPDRKSFLLVFATHC